jgi:hypothetical protein
MKDDLLQLARDLAANEQAGEAHLRRAVSTAYYAAFHALCELVADSIVQDRASDMFETVYRHLRHKSLSKVKLFNIGDAVEGVRAELADLREKREQADYSPFSLGLTQVQANDLVKRAAAVIDALTEWDDVTRRELALRLLIDKGPEMGIQNGRRLS